MDYKELGKKTYREWVKNTGYTITRKKYKEMDKGQNNLFYTGVFEERLKKTGNKRSVGEKAVIAELRKSIEAFAD